MTTWNPADKDADVTLSGGDLIGTVVEGSVSREGGARGTVSRSTGKFCFEVQPNQSSTTSLFVGVALASADISTSPAAVISSWAILQYIPGFLASAASDQESGGVTPVPANNVPVMVAINIDVGLVWFARGGTWLTIHGSEDPGAGVGGLTTYVAETWFPAFYSVPAAGATETYTLNCGATAFSNTLPSGFSAWDTVAGGQPFTKRWGGVRFSGQARSQRVGKRWRAPEVRRPALLLPKRSLILPRKLRG